MQRCVSVRASQSCLRDSADDPRHPAFSDAESSLNRKHGSTDLPHSPLVEECREVNRENVQFDVVIPSTYEAGQATIERIMAVVDRVGFSDRDRFGIRLSLDEAVTNAIKHGNKLSPDKSVSVRFRLDTTGVLIEVEDEGPGFRPEDVPDPTAEENLERPNGRGLMLMREFMTRIEYSPKGNRVVLEKRLPQRVSAN